MVAQGSNLKLLGAETGGWCEFEVILGYILSLVSVGYKVRPDLYKYPMTPTHPDLLLITQFIFLYCAASIVFYSHSSF